MIVLTCQSPDQATMPTKTASSVGQPYRCAIMDPHSIPLAPIQPQQSYLRGLLRPQTPSIPSKTIPADHTSLRSRPPKTD